MLGVTKLLLSIFDKFSFIACVLLGAKGLPILSAGFSDKVLQVPYDYIVLCKHLFLRNRKIITCIQ